MNILRRQLHRAWEWLAECPYAADDDPDQLCMTHFEISRNPPIIGHCELTSGHDGDCGEQPYPDGISIADMVMRRIIPPEHTPPSQPTP